MSFKISDLDCQPKVPIMNRNERPVQWHSANVNNKFYKYGSDSRIYATDILFPLEKLLADTG